MSVRGERRSLAQIHERDVRFVFAKQLDRFPPIRRFGDDHHIRLSVNHAPQPHADHQVILLAGGKGVLIPAKELVSNQPSPVSLMPEGVKKAMTAWDFRELLACLISRN